MNANDEFERMANANQDAFWIAVFRSLLSAFVAGVVCGVVGTLLLQWIGK